MGDDFEQTGDQTPVNEKSQARNVFDRVAQAVFQVEMTVPAQRTELHYKQVQAVKDILVNMQTADMDGHLEGLVRREIAKCNVLLDGRQFR